MGAEQRLARAERVARRGVGHAEIGELVVPNIIEFALSPDYLNLEWVAPRQATMLKLVFLQPDLFTDYDLAVIDEWRSGFSLPDDGAVAHRYTGTVGIPPDIFERIERCRSEDRHWFRQVVFVIGRRGGKGHLGAICTAYVLWNYLALRNPQAYYGISARKRLVAMVFAGQKNQAKGNQYADVAELLGAAPCFDPFLADVGADSTSLWTPNQLDEPGSGPRLPTFEVVAQEATTRAGRGPASFLQIFDEAAHMIATGSNRGLAEIADASTPALAQFGKDAFTLYASSPWTMEGRFFEMYERGLAVDLTTGLALNHDILVVQMPSWGPYLDWELTR